MSKSRVVNYRVKIGSSDSIMDSREQLLPGASSPLIVVGNQGRLTPTSAQIIQTLDSGGADVNRRCYIKDAAGDISSTLLSLVCSSRVPTPKLKGYYANNPQYTEKEVMTIRALIDSGADVSNPLVLTYLCEGEMPSQDFGPCLDVLHTLLEHGALIHPQPGVI